ncbi:MAG: type II toxin-antitoxin system mRNA interferase toxin, RelE/StbE family [Candidatus Omnitrophota bacterium]
MKIAYHKNFNKAFLKLPAKQQDTIKKPIAVFLNNPYDPQLKNHALHGDQKNKRVIAAGGDLRIVFEEQNNYKVVMFYRVGTHSQVY